MCCEPLHPKLCDADEYYHTPIFVVFSVDYYLKIHDTTTFY